MLHLVVKIIGHFIITYCYGELTSLVRSPYQYSPLNKMYLKFIQREAKRINPIAKAQLIDFMNFKYQVQSDIHVMGRDNIFEDIPNQVKNDIVKHRIFKYLKKLPLFAESTESFLKCVFYGTFWTVKFTFYNLSISVKEIEAMISAAYSHNREVTCAKCGPSVADNSHLLKETKRRDVSYIFTYSIRDL